MTTPRQLTFETIYVQYRPVVRLTADNCLYAVDLADFLCRTTRRASLKVDSLSCHAMDACRSCNISCRRKLTPRQVLDSMDPSLMTIPPQASTRGLPYRVLTPDAAIKLVQAFPCDLNATYRAAVVDIIQRLKQGDAAVLSDEPFTWAISDEDDTAMDMCDLFALPPQPAGAAVKTEAAACATARAEAAAPAGSIARVVLGADGIGAAAQAAVPSSNAGPGAARSCSYKLAKTYQRPVAAGAAAKPPPAAAGSNATAATLITNHLLQVKRSVFVNNQPIRVTEDNLVLVEDIVTAVHGGEARHANLVYFLVYSHDKAKRSRARM